MTKAQARQQAKTLRQELTPSEIDRLSAKIGTFLPEMLAQNLIKELAFYLPLPHQKEVNMLAVLAQYFTSNLGLSIPVIAENGTMDAIRWRPTTVLKPGLFGTQIPDTDEIIPPNLLDCILVPLLAYDMQGHRAGYGKGYYDRYLAHCRPDALRVGVSFFGPVTLLDDVWEGDMPLNACITPAGVQWFGR